MEREKDKSNDENFYQSPMITAENDQNEQEMHETESYDGN